MQLIADLQLHSAIPGVSKYMDLQEIARYASKKELPVTCADWQHPVWFTQIREQLQEVEEGFIRSGSLVPEITGR